MTFEEWQDADFDEAAEREDATDSERWTITDDAAADWAVRTISDINMDINRQVEICNQYIAYYQGKITELESKRERRTGFLRACLEDFFRGTQHRLTKSGVHKYDLVSGRLSYKPDTRRISKIDDDKLCAWLKASGRERFVKRVEKPAWADYKKQLAIVGDDVVDTQTGEVVAGCAVEIVPAEFKVEVQ